MKQHKFFERFLDNDLDALAKELNIRYGMIERAEIEGVTPIGNNESWIESGSVSTTKWKQYNVFQFHIDGIRKLYNSISDMTKEACQYYDIDFNSQQYMLQGWFNINYSQVGKLGWHDHGGPEDFAPYFHGFYCVSAEPSSTFYQIHRDPNNVFENINKNNRAILSEMGHPHSMGGWNWDCPRITIAYDIIPFERIKMSPIDEEQHWIPLA